MRGGPHRIFTNMQLRNKKTISAPVTAGPTGPVCDSLQVVGCKRPRCSERESRQVQRYDYETYLKGSGTLGSKDVKGGERNVLGAPSFDGYVREASEGFVSRKDRIRMRLEERDDEEDGRQEKRLATACPGLQGFCDDGFVVPDHVEKSADEVSEDEWDSQSDSSEESEDLDLDSDSEEELEDDVDE